MLCINNFEENEIPCINHLDAKLIDIINIYESITLEEINLLYKGLRPIEEAIVTAGGVSTKEINPKTMEVKKFANIYAIGEVLNIDGFCGGFNLQTAWSTAYVCSSAITK